MDRKTRKIILYTVNIACILIIGFSLYTILLPKKSPETVSITGSLTILSNNNETSTFEFSGEGIYQNMEEGCNVPAAMKLNVTTIESTGQIEVYVNDVLYATGNVTSLGYVPLQSGCGCSTTCICEIKTGENSLMIKSLGFEGELKYEIDVEI